MYLVGEQMADAIKTESIDELVAFLVSKLPDPEKTQFITEVHEKIKYIEEEDWEDVGGGVCEKFDEWMDSKLEKILFTANMFGKMGGDLSPIATAFSAPFPYERHTIMMQIHCKTELPTAHAYERFPVLISISTTYCTYSKFKGYLHEYGAPNPGLGLDLFREKLFEFSYNSVLSGMRNQLLSLLDDIIREIDHIKHGEWY